MKNPSKKDYIKHRICICLKEKNKKEDFQGKFPHEWKNANVVPVHKKGNKQSLKNYRPISLLPVCSKIFERLVYNEMFTSFTENNLIPPSQSGFRPRDSCVNQGPLFPIYINDLSNDISSNCNLFADDTSLLSVVNNIHASATTLSQDLNAITN